MIKGMGLRLNKSIVISLVIVGFFFWHMINSSQVSYSSLNDLQNKSPSNEVVTPEIQDIDTPFMPQMTNETLKAELGNAAWKLFHTILARYPKEPTLKQKGHLKTYIESFAQVYPCGDCARHFIKLLEKYHPQLNSRKNAAMWGCFIHNKVNERLHKPIYDCTTILEDYDCGCGTDETEPDATLDGTTIKQANTKIEDDETTHHLNSIRVESKEKNVGG